jgi:hypothetical protein
MPAVGWGSSTGPPSEGAWFGNVFIESSMPIGCARFARDLVMLPSRSYAEKVHPMDRGANGLVAYTLSAIL